MQASDYAKVLLKVKAVSLDPNFGFTWASGIKSPIYCDNRLLLSYPEERKIIVSGLEDLLKKEFSHAEVLAGTATAGIPHAAFLAQNLNLPMLYVRSKAKEHGKQNTIEGHLQKGQKVLVIEDLISTGKSSMQAVKELQKAGADVIGVMSIFTYGFQLAFETFKEAGIRAKSLLSVEGLLPLTDMSDEDLDKVKQFFKSK